MKKMNRQSRKAGLPPGTLLHVGELKSTTSIVMVCGFGENVYWEKKINNIEECRKVLGEAAPILWVNIDGLAQIDLLQEIGSFFNLHPLTVEDIFNTSQRPKQEDYEDYTYFTCRALSLAETTGAIESEQVSLIIGNSYVLSISERETDIFTTLRKRLKMNKGAVRLKGTDYLAYSLLDIIVDNYFVVLEKTGEKLETLEESILQKPDEIYLQTIHALKREMIAMRQAAWPLREAIIGLEQSSRVFVDPDVSLHLRDVYSHVVQIIDTIEIYREMLSGMLDIYLSSVNNKLNEVMKILTIFAAIFIPLTLISGIYGMNFRYIPELEWFYGYPFALGLMAITAIVLLGYFKRKKWL
jgi:magnesium transporter